MSVRRLTHALIMLLAVLGLSALPAAAASTAPAPASAPSYEDGEFIDEAELDEDPYEFDEETDGEDGDACEVITDDDEFADEGEFGLRTVDDELLEPDDGEFDDEAFDDEFDEDVCETLESAIDEITDVDASGLRKRGVLWAEVAVSGKGKLTSTLTAGDRVLGSAEQKTSEAGTENVRIKLTKKGRRIIRKAKSALELTFSTKLALAGGETVKRTHTLTVKPKKSRKGKRH